MPLLYIDTETRSRTPISLGTDRYTADAECIIVTWAGETGPASIWTHDDGPLPLSLRQRILAPDTTLVAHNASFDRAILYRACGLATPIKKWRCTRAQAYAHGLPGALAALGEVLELREGDRKREEDGKLMHLFCKPRADGSWASRLTHPNEWVRFCNYARSDAIALREIHRRLPSHNYNGDNLTVWWLDQLINERGFQFDSKLALAARNMLQHSKARHDARVSAATAGAVGAATQRDKLLRYLQSKGVDLPNMRAATIRAWLDHDDLRPELRALLELRLEAAKSAGAKYNQGLNSVGKGDRIRWVIQFSGAGRTGRSSGRGFQPHNLFRPTVPASYITEVIVPGILSGEALNEPMIYGGPNEACGNALRSAIRAAMGNELVVADWSNIESRVLAWLADEKWKLAAYRAVDAHAASHGKDCKCGEAPDLYTLLYSQFFGVPVGEVTKHQRQAGKVAELAFGFGGGVGALVAMAATYNMDLDELPAMVLPGASAKHKAAAYRAWRRAFIRGEDFELEADTYMACDILKQVYRETNPAINGMRYDLERAVLGAVEFPGTLHEVAKCRVWKSGDWLVIQLPSGRRLLYAKPLLRSATETDPETGKKTKRRWVSFMAARGKSWRRERAWAGLYVENVVQAIANDVLRAGMLNVHRNLAPELGYTPISIHVHDEIVCDVPRGTLAVDRLVRMMTIELTKQHRWMYGLPLAAEGWAGEHYRK